MEAVSRRRSAFIFLAEAVGRPLIVAYPIGDGVGIGGRQPDGIARSRQRGSPVDEYFYGGLGSTSALSCRASWWIHALVEGVRDGIAKMR